MKDDAVKGVKHKVEEVPYAERTLKPFEHFTPPDVPHDLSIRVFNMSADKTYIVRISEVVEFTSLPKPTGMVALREKRQKELAKETKREKELRKLADDIVDGKLT